MAFRPLVIIFRGDWRTITRMCKSWALVVLVIIAALIISVRGESKGKFLELGNSNGTDIFDLSTVREIQPGRFAIGAVAMRHANLVRIGLEALRTIPQFCSKELGDYPPLKNLFVLGEPQLPVDAIHVKTSNNGHKYVEWDYPYVLNSSSRETFIFRCGIKNEYEEARRLISDGLKLKYVFDCKRALVGSSPENWPGDPQVYEVPKKTILADQYRRVCETLSHERPHDPW